MLLYIEHSKPGSVTGFLKISQKIFKIKTSEASCFPSADSLFDKNIPGFSGKFHSYMDSETYFGNLRPRLSHKNYRTYVYFLFFL